jgi:hypothetical protein
VLEVFLLAAAVYLLHVAIQLARQIEARRTLWALMRLNVWGDIAALHRLVRVTRICICVFSCIFLLIFLFNCFHISNNLFILGGQ